MSISNGEILVFYSSIKTCLREIAEIKKNHSVPDGFLSATEAELACMKKVLEREANIS